MKGFFKLPFEKATERTVGADALIRPHFRAENGQKGYGGLSYSECLRAAGGPWPPLQASPPVILSAAKNPRPRPPPVILSAAKNPRPRLAARPRKAGRKSHFSCGGKPCGNAVEKQFAFGGRPWTFLGFHEKVSSFAFCFIGLYGRKPCSPPSGPTWTPPGPKPRPGGHDEKGRLNGALYGSRPKIKSAPMVLIPRLAQAWIR